eukprot:TRINITY_DN6849_c0_g1_i1.p1 TRINITY_DN6849_c0_g1~~TRINITY_DN6849_c0_g1_i1.p1  ORF type:complete len:171 (-),score=21.53 TRINITY_DN6849_c0_g1_i1:47-559(-)
MKKQVLLKVIPVGEYGAGKSSLVKALTGAQYSASQAFTPIRVQDEIEDTEVTMQIWDTLGQERFGAVAPIYYRGADAILFVYDITSMLSFHKLADWIKDVDRSSYNEKILILVGCKADRPDRQVPTKMARKWAKCHKYHFFEHLLKNPGILIQSNPQSFMEEKCGSHLPS